MNDKKLILVLVQKEEEIKKFETIFALTDFSYSFVKSLNQAIEKMNKYRPSAIIISENIWPPPEIYINEIKRYFPDIPLIVALKAKDIVKKEKYISQNIYVIDFPWTEVELINTIRSIYEKKEEIIILKEKKLYMKYILLFILFFFLSSGIGIYLVKTDKKNIKIDKNITIPSKNISGFFYKENNLYVYDWVIQSFYVFNEKKEMIIKSFITKDIISNLKDSGNGFFFAITDENEIKKINKKDFTRISSKKFDEKIKDLCFDGAYVWILTSNHLIKSFNNDEMTEINRYMLSKPLYADYIGCDSDDKIILYTPSKILVTSSENPKEIIKTITPPEFKVISFDYRKNKLRYIFESHNKSIYSETPIY